MKKNYFYLLFIAISSAIEQHKVILLDQVALKVTMFKKWPFPVVVVLSVLFPCVCYSQKNSLKVFLRSYR